MGEFPSNANGRKQANCSVVAEARSETGSTNSASGETSRKTSGAGRAAVGSLFRAVLAHRG